jgi:hypothetical protein
MFNTYGNGGYLVWRLWPMQKDFIDPRGLSEEAFADYQRMIEYAPDVDQLLDKYGIQVLVLDGFDPFTGHVRRLTFALSDPSQTAWKLVQADEKGVVFMRDPPPGVQPLNNAEAQQHRAAMRPTARARSRQPACASGLAQIYLSATPPGPLTGHPKYRKANMSPAPVKPAITMADLEKIDVRAGTILAVDEVRWTNWCFASASRSRARDSLRHEAEAR